MSKFKETINSGKPVLVDFFAEWCGPCQTMTPVLQKLAGEMGDSVKIIKVDIDKNPGASKAFNVRGVPTFIIFKDGKPVWRASGAQPKSELEKALRAAGV
ncbi:MAG: thioredoxin [Cryomorphaceae bacterium]|nr:thioredoxin [Flavobacteriales bacterium]